ncbi:MAG: hypothetical protein CMJ78_20405 [Planctomycetaceae bacterium]|nr:hypothetical protein [Planctomycetaceae bacterium]
MRSLIPLLACLAAVGCTTTSTSNTARTSVEQLLVSNSIDQTLEQIDFRVFKEQNVFIDDKFLDCVDKNYLVGSVRHRAARGGATLVGARDNADVVLELRSGGVGTDNSEAFVGVPEIVLPGMITLPEVRLLTRTAQRGVAKIGMFAYDAKTNRPLGDGGVSVAVASDNNWYVMGVGPFQNGTIQDELSDSVQPPVNFPLNDLPSQIAFGAKKPHTVREPIRLTSGVKEISEPELIK